ncbi:condensation domain-containing protein [Actinacidiphila bryophytorum]|uniref:condensation domain-containing protein n=1 Tax=Actinacidiphila bryophytorum TaxID=1436133 RepID=UPI002176CE11|nr:condensation domain-containing protein [Actinacidiphila bryophytorum]UWE08647.1 condensation domain-containing protein [Actinacidiphila bryophytorum]
MAVSFAGPRGRTTRLAWGQQTTWDDIQFFLPEVKYFSFLRAAAPVAEGMDLDGVLDCVRDLLVRHDCLRTTIVTEPDGSVLQTVRERGELPVELVHAGSDTDEAVEAQAVAVWNRLRSRNFDHANEFPVRCAVVLRDASPARVVLCLSHAVADWQTARLVGREMADIMASRSAGRTDSGPVPPPGPADLAQYEASPQGQQLNAAALEHYREQLSRFPSTMFGTPVPVASPRYLGAGLESSAVPLALGVLGARYRTGTSALLLAVTAALLGGLTGDRRCALMLLSGNRTTVGTRQALGSLGQTVPTIIEPASDSFADLVEAASSSSLRAYRRGRFDPRAAASLVAEEERLRGHRLDLGCRFNDMWSPGASAPSDTSLDQIREAAATTRFTWTGGTDADKITFFLDVFGPAQTATLHLLADSHRIPEESIRGFLLGVEAVLLDLLKPFEPRGGEPTVTELQAVAGLTAPCTAE